jgi:hypothetical protein
MRSSLVPVSEGRGTEMKSRSSVTDSLRDDIAARRIEQAGRKKPTGRVLGDDRWSVG